MQYLSLALTLILPVVFANDKSVYQYTNAQGNLVVGNTATAQAQKMELPPLNIYTSPITAADLKAKGYTEPSLNQAKNITKANPYLGLNEIRRKEILQEELAREKIALNDSKQMLSQGKSIKLISETNSPQQYMTRIQGLKDAVAEHQRNIDILNKQLGN
ncbi:MAG: hypothetical protein ACK4M7_10010 [Burkholderiales bacterium]